jgi:hypothetical protein
VVLCFLTLEMSQADDINPLGTREDRVADDHLHGIFYIDASLQLCEMMHYHPM